MEQNRREDEDDVRALDDQERIATQKRDVPTMERLWSEQLTVNAPNNQVVIGRRAVLDTFVHSGVINFSCSSAKSSSSASTAPSSSSWGWKH
jgi:hypothetical protein